MASYLITGSSRGLGMALVKRLASFPTSEVSTIFATARSDSTALKKLAELSSGRIVVVNLDTTKASSIEKAVAQVTSVLGGKGLDVLINNAGMMEYTPNGIENMADLNQHFNTNVVGVHLVTSAFLPLLEKGNKKKIVNISSTLGSITWAKTWSAMPVPAYKVSKAALNALTVQYALSFADKGFTVFALSPGWLQTELGGDSADLTVEEGGKASLDCIMNAGVADNGTFRNILVPGWEKNPGRNQYDGGNPPW